MKVTAKTITDEQIRELRAEAFAGRWGYGYGHARHPTGRRNAHTRALAVDCEGVLESRHHIAAAGVVEAYNRLLADRARKEGT